tara:strand:+ start:719 stop:1225 length:507 start_codon:yes stop_codon:yes gene_type:complete
MKAENITVKLFLLRKEIGAISKDSNNPFFKSKYFDINTLIKQLDPYLEKHKILLSQPIINNEVKTILQCIDDNSFRNSSLELSPNLDAQKKGSEITYFRRYTLASLLGLQAVDDDGNLAAKGLPHLLDNSEEFENSKAKLKAGKITLEGIKTHYKVSSFIENKLTKNN